MFTSNVQFGYLCPSGGEKLSRLVCLATHPGFGSGSVICQFLLHHNLRIFSCKRYEHYFSKTETFTSNVQFGYLFHVRGVGGKLSRLVYLATFPGFGSGSVISQFLLHHYLVIFSCKTYKHYFSQPKMFTSNVQFGYLCTRVGGASCPA